MLTQLQIRDFAIVEAVELELAAGLHRAHRRDRRRQVDPRRCAAARRRRSRRQRRRAPRRRARRGDRDASTSRRNPARSPGSPNRRSRTTAKCCCGAASPPTAAAAPTSTGRRCRCSRCARSASTCSTSTASSSSSRWHARGYQRDLLDEQRRASAPKWPRCAMHSVAGASSTSSARPSSSACAIASSRIELLAHYVAELDALDPQGRRAAAARRGAPPHLLGRASGRRHGAGGKPAGGRRRRRRRRAGPGPVAAAQPVEPRSGARRHRAAARGSRHRLPRGRREPASLRGFARGRSGAPGMGRVAPRRARGSGPQASRRGRAPAGPAQRTRPRNWPACAMVPPVSRTSSADSRPHAPSGTASRAGSRTRAGPPAPRSTSASAR